jgi:hypothetical protein
MVIDDVLGPRKGSDEDDNFDLSIGGPFKNSYDRELTADKEKQKLKNEDYDRQQEKDSFEHGTMYREY